MDANSDFEASEITMYLGTLATESFLHVTQEFTERCGVRYDGDRQKSGGGNVDLSADNLSASTY